MVASARPGVRPDRTALRDCLLAPGRRRWLCRPRWRCRPRPIPLRRIRPPGHAALPSCQLCFGCIKPWDVASTSRYHNAQSMLLSSRVARHTADNITITLAGSAHGYSIAGRTSTMMVPRAPLPVTLICCLNLYCVYSANRSICRTVGCAGKSKAFAVAVNALQRSLRSSISLAG